MPGRRERRRRRGGLNVEVTRRYIFSSAPLNGIGQIGSVCIMIDPIALALERQCNKWIDKVNHSNRGLNLTDHYKKGHGDQ